MITKICTDIEQSKKLAEILPIESADMCWCNNSIRGVNYTDDFSILTHTIQELKDTFDGALNGWDKYWKLIPAWSLSTLLSMIPVSIEYKDRWHRLRMDKGLSDFSIWYDILDSGIASDIDVTAKDPVDACAEMIVQLNNKEMI